MRLLISLPILFILFNTIWAQDIKYSDVPENHWAEAAIRKLVKEGIISGYEDGTFRGLKYMTRAEIAAILSNLSKKAKDDKKLQKILAELKTEFAALKYESENPQTPKTNFDLSEQILIAKGAKLNYRLKLSFFEKLGRSGDIKVNFDTKDTGWNGPSRNLALELLDFESRITSGGVNFKISAGPGPITHRESDDLTPFLDYLVFDSPRTSFLAQTNMYGLDAALGYTAHQPNTFGNIATHEAKAVISYRLNKTTLTFSPRYFLSEGKKDALAEISIFSNPTEILGLEFTLGAGHLRSQSGLFAKVQSSIKTENTSIEITAYKAGASYRSELNKDAIVYLNNFDKAVADGLTDIGLNIERKVSNRFYLILKADSAQAKTGEFRLLYRPAEKAGFSVFYRTFSNPQASDLFGFEAGLKM